MSADFLMGLKVKWNHNIINDNSGIKMLVEVANPIACTTVKSCNIGPIYLDHCTAQQDIHCDTELGGLSYKL